MIDGGQRSGPVGADPTSENPSEWPTGRLLFTVVRRMEHEWNAHLGSWELNHASLPVLLHLLAGPRPQRDLARLSNVTEQTMSRVVARLERSGYVTRTTDARDRRRHAVAVTDAGRRVALEAARIQPAEELASRGLTSEQVAALREILVAMVMADRSADGAPEEPHAAVGSHADVD